MRRTDEDCKGEFGACVLIGDVKGDETNTERVEEEISLLALYNKEAEHGYTNSYDELYNSEVWGRPAQMEQRAFSKNSNDCCRRRTMMMIGTTMSGSTKEVTKCPARSERVRM